MGFSLKHFAEEATAQLIPGDNKTAATVRAARAKPAPAQTIRKENRSLVSRVIDQVNPDDSGRTFNNPTPHPFHSANFFQKYSPQNIAGGIGEGVVNTVKDAVITPTVNTVKLPADLITNQVTQFSHDPNVRHAGQEQLQEHANNSFISPLAQLAHIGGTNLAANKILNDRQTSPALKQAQLKEAVNPSYQQAGFNLDDRGARLGLKEAALVGQAVATPVFMKSGSAVKPIAREASVVAKNNTPTAIVGKQLSSANASYKALEDTANQKAAQINKWSQMGKNPPAYLARGYENDLRSLEQMRKQGKNHGSINPDYSDGGVPLENTSTNNTASNMGQAGRASNANINQIPSSYNPNIAPRQIGEADMARFMERIKNPTIEPPVKEKPLPGTTNQSEPFIDSNRVSLKDKAFRSTRSVIERQGESGKQLAELLQKSRDTQELHQAEILKSIPTVRSLKGKDFENFVHATQGLEEAASPKVAKAVTEWQKTHPAIRERGVNPSGANLDIGDLGPNYYPHFVDYDKIYKNKNLYNKALQHLVDTKQAGSIDEAIKLLGYGRDVSRNRSFGSLEASRIVDLPFYDKTPNSLTSYIQGSTKRIAQAENFGKADEHALKLIHGIAKEGYDAEAAKNAFDIASGAKQYGETGAKLSQGARKYITTTRLGLGAITNTSQSVNTGIVTGHLRTMGAMLKQFSPKTRSFVEDTGTVADAVINDIREQTGFTGKVLSKITAPGFGKVEKFNRSVAATAGRDYANKLARKGDIKTLKKLGVEGNIGKNLTEAQQIQAARKIVEKTQFKVDPQDLPGWVDSPGGKLVAQFRTFSYNQGKFFSNEILKPAAKGNLLPLSRLLAALPVGYGLYKTKRAISGRPEEDNKVRKGADVFGNIGGAGLALDVYRSLVPLNGKYLSPDRRVSMAAGTFLGPAAAQGMQAVGALSEAVQKKNIPDDPSRLDGKVAPKSGDQYRDLTPISRFGLQQIPVGGVAISNRVLPYKKESEANTGKATGNAALDGLLKDKKQQTKDLKASLSKEDYKLSQLSDADREKLVSSGGVTKSKLEGLDNYVNNKKRDLGMEVTAKTAPALAKEYKDTLNRFSSMKDDEKDKVIRSEKDAEYKLELAKYENDKASGKLSRVEDMKRTKELKRQKAGSTFDKDTREFYSLNKGEIFDFITSDENGKKLADQLLSYDDELVKSGAITKNKFRDKYGNADFDSSSATSSKSKKSTTGKSKKSKSKFDYKLYGLISNPTSTSHSLRDLVKQATLDKKKA
jgi:hypothetical protein